MHAFHYGICMCIAITVYLITINKVFGNLAVPIYVIGFGKAYIVHTSNFSCSRTHKIQKEQYTDLKFAGMIRGMVVL